MYIILNKSLVHHYLPCLVKFKFKFSGTFEIWTHYHKRRRFKTGKNTNWSKNFLEDVQILNRKLQWPKRHKIHRNQSSLLASGQIANHWVLGKKKYPWNVNDSVLLSVSVSSPMNQLWLVHILFKMQVKR